MSRNWRRMRRLVSSPSLWVFALVTSLALASNYPGVRSGSFGLVNADERPSLKSMNDEKSLMREGTALTEVRGRFKVANERYVFMDEINNQSLTCLENLMLQRVYYFLKDDEGGRQRWSVSGKITEYNGENFLWIDRAMRVQ